MNLMEVSSMPVKTSRNALQAIALILILIATVCANPSGQRRRNRNGVSPDQSVTIPENTVISVKMNGTLSSKTSRVGDRFTATVSIPVYVNGAEVIPAGAIVEGRVTGVTSAKRMGKAGTIAIDFDNLVYPDGSRIPLDGSLTSDDPETRRQIDDESRVSGRDNRQIGVFVGGGGAVGAVLGGIAGGGKGAAAGGAIGAGIGIATVLLSKGEDAQVPSGASFGVQLRQAILLMPNPAATGQPVDSNDPNPASDPPPSVRPDRTRNADDAYERPSNSKPTQAPESTEPEPLRNHPDNNKPEAEAEPEANSAPTVTDAPPLPLSSPEMIRRAQISLNEQGYYEGEADGHLNLRTVTSLKAYQREHNLQETEELDQPTAVSLGILSSTANPASRAGRPNNSANSGARPARTNAGADDQAGQMRTVLANVSSASATRLSDGSINVVIVTQANTGGWRWYGEPLVNGDTLEVFARAIRPTGMVTQALTKGRIELNAKDGVAIVQRVVVHSAGPDQVLSLQRGVKASPAASAPTASNLPRQAEDLLSEYQRQSGVRISGNGVELENGAQYREAEVELLFALDNFAKAAQLYARLIPSLQSPESVRSATLSLARQARRTDLVLTSSQSRFVSALMPKWDMIRQEVLRLMQSYSISTRELEN
jgi:hypothetical protein